MKAASLLRFLCRRQGVRLSVLGCSVNGHQEWSERYQSPIANSQQNCVSELVGDKRCKVGANDPIDCRRFRLLSLLSLLFETSLNTHLHLYHNPYLHLYFSPHLHLYPNPHLHPYPNPHLHLYPNSNLSPACHPYPYPHPLEPHFQPLLDPIFSSWCFIIVTAPAFKSILIQFINSKSHSIFWLTKNRGEGWEASPLP